MRRFSAFLLALLFSFPALASTQQVMIGRSNVNTGTTAGVTIPLGMTGEWSVNKSTIPFFGAVPVAGTWSHCHVYVDTAPGSGQGWSAALQDNGNSEAPACTISNTATACFDNTDTYTSAAGDQVFMRLQISGTPASNVGFYTYCDFTPATNNQTVLIFAQNGTVSNKSTDDYSPAFANQVPVTTESSTRNVLPEPGVFSNFWVGGNNAVTSGSFAPDLNDGGTSTGITCTINTTNNTFCSDTTHTYTAAASDLLDIQTNPSSASTNEQFGGGMLFAPNTVGDFFFSALWITADSTTATVYDSINGGDQQSTEALATEYTDAMTVTKMYVRTNLGPGTSKTRTFTLNKNGSATSCSIALTNTMVGTSTTCNVSFNQGDTIDISDTPTTGSPAAVTGSIAIIANRYSANNGDPIFFGLQ